MKYLNYKKLYCEGKIACHFLKPILAHEPLTILIPGGPCISGHYLSEFSFHLANANKINVGLINLPNHDESILPDSLLPLTYQHCLEMISDALNEISIQTNHLILFGQSFGARLAFDLLANYAINIKGLFLTGFPYVLQISSTLQEKFSTLKTSNNSNGDVELSFLESWKEILPLYTYSPLPENIFNALIKNTKFRGNEHILKKAPSIELSVENLLKKQSFCPITILEGDCDLVVPDNNIQKLKSLISCAKFITINQCGHFPMVEQPEATQQAFSNFYASLEKSACI